ncbi:MAG: hypothetical protein V3T96_05155 [Thermodesulfobacteriota bacterium]
MKRLQIFAVAIFLLILSSSTAHALLKVEGRYWFSSLDSEIKYTEAGIMGTEINLIDDLGMDDSENFQEGRITLEMGNHKLRYAYTPLSWDGQKSVADPIQFGGETFSALVDSSLDIKYHRLGYEYDFLDVLDNKIGVIFEIKYFDIDARLKATGIDESTTAKVPIPTIGVTGQVAIPFLFSVGGELSGITLGSRGYLFDGEVVFNFHPLPLITISGGYRILKMKLEEGDDKALFDLKGPFLVLRAGF